MRPSDPPPPPADGAYVDMLRGLATPHGITHVGVAPAEVLSRAREVLFQRRREGLHDGMEFTYRNPTRSTDPSAAVRGARSIVVAARPYLLDEVPAAAPQTSSRPATSSPTIGGRVARYAWADHYAPLRAGLWAMAHRLRADGWKAVPFADDNSLVDREVAHLAGLGWYGKNANLLINGAGSWFVLGSVVTTAPLPVAEAPAPDGCGTCARCIDGCPTAAIIEPGVVDAARCLAWLLQKPGMFDRRFRVALGDRMYGCDECQEVCPPTVRLGERYRRAADPPAQATVDVLALLDADDETLLRTWGRWYLADRNPRWLRRNALVVLGNVAVAGDERVSAVLVRYLAADDPYLRAHAVWAARRLGLVGLLPADDPDPDVAAELTAPL